MPRVFSSQGLSGLEDIPVINARADRKKERGPRPEGCRERHRKRLLHDEIGPSAKNQNHPALAGGSDFDKRDYFLGEVFFVVLALGAGSFTSLRIHC